MVSRTDHEWYVGSGVCFWRPVMNTPKEAENDVEQTERAHPAHEAFLGQVDKASARMLGLALFLEKHRESAAVLNRKFFFDVYVAAYALEEFLDDHGASKNTTWLMYRELSATAKAFGFVAYLADHIGKSHISCPERSELTEYHEHTGRVKHYLDQVLSFTVRRFLEEAQALSVSMPHTLPPERWYEDLPADESLPSNIDTAQSKNARERLLKIASQYRKAVHEFQDFECNRHYDPKELCAIIPDQINEERIRRFELVIHNLESSYDTYVKNTTLEADDSRMAHLRTHISIALHLLESARTLAHFYERHEPINALLEEAISAHTVLDCTVNWALYFTRHFLVTAEDLVSDILADYATMESVKLPVPQKLGFHLRPSTLVAKVVDHYGSEVRMIVGEDTFSAGSVLDLVWAGGKIAREKIDTVTFVGDKRTLEDLKILAGVNYGEDSMGKDIPLPKEIAYLRR